MRSRSANLLHSFRRAHYPTASSAAAPSLPFAAATRHQTPQTGSALRWLSIQATPSSQNSVIDAPQPAPSDSPSSAPIETPDARFEVLGSTSSLLSVTLAASQTLFTRRGTLAGVSGSPENATSTLSLLSPLTRSPVGIPFLYQKISSPTPLNLLLATKAPHTSFSVVHLDGRIDWTVAQRAGIVAWTGHTLTVRPSVNYSMSLAHWGNSVVMGRGLVALAAAGNTYQITLKAGEHYVAHPGNVLAYTIGPNAPQPYRFKSSTLRLQVPSISTIIPDNNFFRELRATAAYKFLANALFKLRTWTRRTIWADRLFLQFHGPGTILLQSRGGRIRDVLSSQDVNEIADVPAGIVQVGSKANLQQGRQGGGTAVADAVAVPGASSQSTQHATSTKVSYASVGKDGKVGFSSS